MLMFLYNFSGIVCGFANGSMAINCCCCGVLAWKSSGILACTCYGWSQRNQHANADLTVQVLLKQIVPKMRNQKCQWQKARGRTKAVPGKRQQELLFVGRNQNPKDWQDTPRSSAVVQGTRAEGWGGKADVGKLKLVPARDRQKA